MNILICKCAQRRWHRAYRRIVVRQKRSGQRNRNRQALKLGQAERVRDRVYVGYTD